MEKPKLKKIDQAKVKKNKPKKAQANLEDDSFDFGGLPKDVDLKRNIGCGG